MLDPKPIPPFRTDGYLPEGVHLCTEATAIFRLGSHSARRRMLVGRVRRWLALARAVGARRLLIDGSFVTAKVDPEDVDAVVLLGPDFAQRLERGDDDALEFEEMLRTRRPEELFAADDDADWIDWVTFFSRTREADGRGKGLVEIVL